MELGTGCTCNSCNNVWHTMLSKWCFIGKLWYEISMWNLFGFITQFFTSFSLLQILAGFIYVDLFRFLSILSVVNSAVLELMLKDFSFKESFWSEFFNFSVYQLNIKEIFMYQNFTKSLYLSHFQSVPFISISVYNITRLCPKWFSADNAMSLFPIIAYDLFRILVFKSLETTGFIL